MKKVNNINLMIIINNRRRIMITINHYTYRDENDIIESFKNTLKPKYKSDTEFSDFNKQDHVEFQSIMGWFKENDYFNTIL